MTKPRVNEVKVMTGSAPIPATELALDARAEQINQCLPQTQCMRCGYAGCAPYAQAIASNRAPINQCPPGGAAAIAQLAKLLNKTIVPLDASKGLEAPLQAARIVEADCIGCTKCIQVCPVDAIVGASKRMHTVISLECTSCELCIPACPVDCIVLEPHPMPQMSASASAQARQRFEARASRVKRRAREQADAMERKRKLLRGEI